MLHPFLKEEGMDKAEWYPLKLGVAKWNTIEQMAIARGEASGIKL